MLERALTALVLTETRSRLRVCKLELDMVRASLSSGMLLLGTVAYNSNYSMHGAYRAARLIMHGAWMSLTAV